MKFKDEVKDTITGFAGSVIATAEYVTGCTQFLVQPKCDKDRSKKPEAIWFDETRLKITKVYGETKKEKPARCL